MQATDRWRLAACLALGMVTPALATSESVRWQCDVAYMPQRSTWVREVVWITRQDGAQAASGVQAVWIDGQPVHAFTIEGDRVLTAMDNERIAIDLSQRQWQSDFRQAASGQGRCALAEPRP